MKKQIFMLMASILIIIVYAEIPSTAPKVNGYPLDYCSHVGCGESTASIYCGRTNQGKLDSFEKGAGAKAAGGTWRYTSTGGNYNINGDEYFNFISCNFTGQLYIGGTNTSLIVYSNGYPLDYCSFAACGQSTAEVYCQRAEGKGLLSYEKGSGVIAGDPGTWKYTIDSGYHDAAGTQFFKSIVCGNEPKPEPGIACYSDSECGEGTWLTQWGIYYGPRCLDGKIYQPYQYYTCNNAGSYQSECVSGVNAWQVKEECQYGCSAQTNSCNTPPEVCDGVDNDFDGEIDENNPCNDGVYCNGLETCNNGACVVGTPIVCSDGIDCTVDYCDEYSDSCGKPIPYDSRCDDKLYCNGKETCDKNQGCKSGISPCNDNVACTNNICNENTDSCSYLEDNSYCNDGLYCNGQETCSWLFGCQSGTPPATGGFACVTYTCDEGNDIVWRYPNDNYCSDGLYCNGFEWCSVSKGCMPGTQKNCNDGISCTTDSCNENTDSCDNIPADNDGDSYNCLGDCNDNNNMLWQLLPGYRDNDLDTYGINPLMQVCSGAILPLSYVINNIDCDDSDANSYPGAEEVLDGKDNDCDSLIDEYLCGNGLLDVSNELCDDGNLINGDRCNSACFAEDIALDFDEFVVIDNGDGTYNYTFSDAGIPLIDIPQNDGLIDWSNVSFDYAEGGNVVSLLISNLTLTGTTKMVTIRFKRDLCIVDKSTVLGGSTTGSPDCFADPDRVVWLKNNNECNQNGIEVIGKDASGVEVPAYTCEQVTYSQAYAKIKGLTHSLIVARDPVDEDGDGYTEDDCDSNNPDINPASIELPGNNIDENCDNIKLCNPEDNWKNHGNFVSCVTKESERLLKQKLITKEEKDKIISDAAKSNIGKSLKAKN
ncbi:MAG TPA: putative metal-binding motif-containing protein [Candidatus Nanoarchaeia archaeon]|nr:putative metal-binding motif-containing protein [Candidatus Nanoarchaeia archaeon]